MQQQTHRPDLEAHDPVHTPLEFVQAEFLGATVHAMTMEAMHDVIAYAIETQQKWLIAHHNLHSLYLLNKEMKGDAPYQIQDFYKLAKFTNIDGMSMVVLARLHGYPVNRSHRFTYSHTFRSQLALAQRRGWRVFYLGSSEFVAKEATKTLKTEFPHLIFAAHHGFFAKETTSPGNAAVIGRIAAFRPNILYVGMGMPSQEKWIEENYDALTANVILSAGATLDYVAGTLQAPPDWIGRLGLQWLHRLVHEPRRLGFRYLIEPWLMCLYAARNAAHEHLRLRRMR